MIDFYWLEKYKSNTLVKTQMAKITNFDDFDNFVMTSFEAIKMGGSTQKILKNLSMLEEHAELFWLLYFIRQNWFSNALSVVWHIFENKVDQISLINKPVSIYILADICSQFAQGNQYLTAPSIP